MKLLKKPGFATVSGVSICLLLAGSFYVYGQDKAEFPDGFDAMQAAPKSHKVIFENALVRALKVTVPAAGEAIPMHHHRWPSFFLSWIREGSHRTFVIIGPTAALKTIRAGMSLFIRALGVCSG